MPLPAAFPPHPHATASRPELRLLLGDQLDPLHAWFVAPSDAVVYVLMEVRSETDYVLHHAQKVIALFAAMRSFAARLRAAGHRVRYVRLDAPSNRQSLAANLDALLAHYGSPSLRYQAPDEWRVDQHLAGWVAAASARGIQIAMDDSEHFLTGRADAAAYFAGSGHWLMERFYRHMRQRHGVLLQDDGRPVGGRWNFDADNRRAWPGHPPAPADWRAPHDHRDIEGMLQACGVRTFGQARAYAMPWPLGREEALDHLAAFVQHALPHFGDFQDAMSTHEPRLFHSLLSFALNTKMLRPREVIDAAVAAWRAGQAPLHAVEGFVRQILGWREYVRGVYWARMPGYTDSNALGHHTALPGWFWSGDTRMACVRAAVGQSLRDAHAHHIQRLMVIGNFALLAGLAPQAVHAWYLGVYVDAFEWVEAPNTLGMSQFADGGLLATKPYISGAAYIRRMSDHCAQCPYDPRQRTGERACPFNALYWNFLMRHAPRLQDNPRLAMPYRQIERMADADREALAEHAVSLMRRLDAL